jgi:hypothetical protein
MIWPFLVSLVPLWFSIRVVPLSPGRAAAARNHGALLPRRAIPSTRNGPYLNFTPGRMKRESRVSMRV